MTVLIIVFIGLGPLAAGVAGAQAAAPDSASCDSIVTHAVVDSVSNGLFLIVRRADDGDLAPGQPATIVEAVAEMFEVPHPFRLTTFAGPVELRALRLRGADTAPVLRSPAVTGGYRVWSDTSGAVLDVETVRTSLAPGFDSAATASIRAAALAPIHPFASPDSDEMPVDVRISSDSIPNARRFVTLRLPRMPVVDAHPLSDSLANAPPTYPAVEQRDSVEGQVVLRVVVGRDGAPMMETVETERATSQAFAAAAIAALAARRFTPARVRACAVSQVIEVPFDFRPPASRSPLGAG